LLGDLLMIWQGNPFWPSCCTHCPNRHKQKLRLIIDTRQPGLAVWDSIIVCKFASNSILAKNASIAYRKHWYRRRLRLWTTSCQM